MESTTTHTHTETRCCSSCNSKEGASHPLYSFRIILKGFESKWLCQKCLVRAEVNAMHKNYVLKKHSRWLNLTQQAVKRMTAITRHFLFFGVLLIVTELAMAQPGLPGSPTQAPIDGGLGLLAAAGGAYAIKKLRAKKSE